MSPEAQRIAIAEARGYSFREEGWRYPDDEDWQKYKAVYHGAGLSEGFIGLARPDWIPVPDYLNDFKAIREAVVALTKEQQAEFAEYLADARHLDGIGIWSYDDAFVFITATPAEWAAAYLRTLGLFKS